MVSTPTQTADASQLTPRQREILSAVITEFTQSGQPVASRAIGENYGLECSPATIRNELKALEDRGLLVQPHLSSGRVPTQAAFRLFIDALMRVQRLRRGQARRIAAWLGGLAPDADIARETGRLLSELSGTAAVLIRPRPAARPLLKVHFVPTRPEDLLAVIVFVDGEVSHRFVPRPERLGTSGLERLNNLLDEFVRGRTLAEVEEQLRLKVDAFRDELRAATQLGAETLAEALKEKQRGPEVIVEGSARLLEHRQFQDGANAREVLSALEDHESVLRLVNDLLHPSDSGEDAASDDEPRVLIGGDALGEAISLVATSLHDPSAAPHYPGSRAGQAAGYGALGVIGPTPMNYPSVVPLVRAVANAMTAAMEKSKER